MSAGGRGGGGWRQAGRRRQGGTGKRSGCSAAPLLQPSQATSAVQQKACCRQPPPPPGAPAPPPVLQRSPLRPPVVEHLLAVGLALRAVEAGAQQRHHQAPQQPPHPLRQPAPARGMHAERRATLARATLARRPCLLQPGHAPRGQPPQRLVQAHDLVAPQAHKAVDGAPQRPAGRAAPVDAGRGWVQGAQGRRREWVQGAQGRGGQSRCRAPGRREWVQPPEAGWGLGQEGREGCTRSRQGGWPHAGQTDPVWQPAQEALDDPV